MSDSITSTAEYQEVLNHRTAGPRGLVRVVAAMAAGACGSTRLRLPGDLRCDRNYTLQEADGDRVEE